MSLKGALNQNGLVFFKPIWIASKIWLGRICCSICYIIHFGFNWCLLGIPWPKYDLWISHGFKTDDTVSDDYVISLQVWRFFFFKYCALKLKIFWSFISAITILGTPAEIYVFGTQYWMIGLSYPFVLAATAHIYFPVYFK